MAHTGSTTRARSASSAAALSAAKASGAQGVSLGDFEGLLVEKDAQISDLQESNRYFLRQVRLLKDFVKGAARSCTA